MSSTRGNVSSAYREPIRVTGVTTVYFYTKSLETIERAQFSLLSVERESQRYFRLIVHAAMSTRQIGRKCERDSRFIGERTRSKPHRPDDLRG